MRLMLILALAMLIGCKPAPTAPTAPRKLSVIATAFPLADIARRVGGELVEVSWIVESGQSLKGLQPDAELRNRLRSADLILMGSVVSEAWATEGSGSGEQYARILRLEALPSSRQAAQPGIQWLNPAIIKEAITEFAQRLYVLRPQNSAGVTARADRLIQEIDKTVSEYSPRLLAAENRRIMVLNDDFIPLLSYFHFQPIRTVDVLPTRLTDENIRLIQYIARENGTTRLILPADTPAAAVEDLRLRSGLQLILLDALGSSAAGGRNSYIDLLAWNLDQLTKATVVQ